MKVLRYVFIFILFIFLLSSLIKNFVGFQRNLSFYESYKTESENELQKNAHLKTQKLIKTDPSEVEKTIRNKLGLLRDNEIAIIIPLPSPSPSPAHSAPLPVYAQWVRVFTN